MNGENRNEAPPSYQDAVEAVDVLSLAARGSPEHYKSLCLVSRRHWEFFAPLLWKDPLKSARINGLHVDNGAEWYVRFISEHISTVRPSTRSLIRTVDFRTLPLPTLIDDFYGITGSGSAGLATSLGLLSVLPELRCLILDGYPVTDTLGFLSRITKCQVLSLRRTQAHLPLSFFQLPFLKTLVYLDVSGLPGSLKSALVRNVLSRSSMPNLRILVAQSREMADAEAEKLIDAFKCQLWSVDLRGNKLTDKTGRYLIDYPVGRLRSITSHGDREVEGALRGSQSVGVDSFGPFIFLQESEQSSDFCHPNRYYADAPVYSNDTFVGPHENHVDRSSGSEESMDDSLESVKKTLEDPGLSNEDVRHLPVCQPHSGGITHVRISGNNITADGVMRMIRSSSGHFELLDIGAPFMPECIHCLPVWLGKQPKITGLLGAAHLFRPVFLPNLRSLRIHHSLVTNTVSVAGRDAEMMEALWLVENFVQERADLAYPKPFVPDMNPRLRSLTLTDIPRLSSGPVLERLKSFLDQLDAQEEAIRRARTSSRRGLPTLPGLRQLILEFDDLQEPENEDQLFGNSESLDSFDPHLMDSDMKEDFSFFEGGWKSSEATTEANAMSSSSDTTHTGIFMTTASMTVASLTTASPTDASFSTSSSTQPKADLVAQHMPHTELWCDGNITHNVWIGSTDARRQHPAVDAYMKALNDDKFLHHVEPASPSHVAAGVPYGELIFGAAWDAILWERARAVQRPSRQALSAVEDVVDGLKKHRPQWTGTLKMVGRHGRAL